MSSKGVRPRRFVKPSRNDTTAVHVKFPPRPPAILISKNSTSVDSDSEILPKRSQARGKAVFADDHSSSLKGVNIGDREAQSRARTYNVAKPTTRRVKWLSTQDDKDTKNGGGNGIADNNQSEDEGDSSEDEVHMDYLTPDAYLTPEEEDEEDFEDIRSYVLPKLVAEAKAASSSKNNSKPPKGTETKNVKMHLQSEGKGTLTNRTRTSSESSSLFRKEDTFVVTDRRAATNLSPTDELRRRKAMALAKANARHSLKDSVDQPLYHHENDSHYNFSNRGGGGGQGASQRHQRPFIEGTSAEVKNETGEKIYFHWKENEGSARSNRTHSSRGPSALNRLYQYKKKRLKHKHSPVGATKSAPNKKGAGHKMPSEKHAEQKRSKTATSEPSEDENQEEEIMTPRSGFTERQGSMATINQGKSRLSRLSTREAFVENGTPAVILSAKDNQSLQSKAVGGGDKLQNVAKGTEGNPDSDKENLKMQDPQVRNHSDIQLSSASREASALADTPVVTGKISVPPALSKEASKVSTKALALSKVNQTYERSIIKPVVPSSTELHVPSEPTSGSLNVDGNKGTFDKIKGDNRNNVKNVKPNNEKSSVETQGKSEKATPLPAGTTSNLKSGTQQSIQPTLAFNSLEHTQKASKAMNQTGNNEVLVQAETDKTITDKSGQMGDRKLEKPEQAGRDKSILDKSGQSGDRNSEKTEHAGGDKTISDKNSQLDNQKPEKPEETRRPQVAKDKGNVTSSDAGFPEQNSQKKVEPNIVRPLQHGSQTDKGNQKGGSILNHSVKIDGGLQNNNKNTPIQAEIKSKNIKYDQPSGNIRHADNVIGNLNHENGPRGAKPNHMVSSSNEKGNETKVKEITQQNSDRNKSLNDRHNTEIKAQIAGAGTKAQLDSRTHSEEKKVKKFPIKQPIFMPPKPPPKNPNPAGIDVNKNNQKLSSSENLAGVGVKISPYSSTSSIDATHNKKLDKGQEQEKAQPKSNNSNMSNKTPASPSKSYIGHVNPYAENPNQKIRSRDQPSKGNFSKPGRRENEVKDQTIAHASRTEQRNNILHVTNRRNGRYAINKPTRRGNGNKTSNNKNQFDQPRKHGGQPSVTGAKHGDTKLCNGKAGQVTQQEAAVAIATEQINKDITEVSQPERNHVLFVNSSEMNTETDKARVTAISDSGIVTNSNLISERNGTVNENSRKNGILPDKSVHIANTASDSNSIAGDAIHISDDVEAEGNGAVLNGGQGEERAKFDSEEHLKLHLLDSNEGENTGTLPLSINRYQNVNNDLLLDQIASSSDNVVKEEDRSLSNGKFTEPKSIQGNNEANTKHQEVKGIVGHEQDATSKTGNSLVLNSLNSSLNANTSSETVHKAQEGEFSGENSEAKYGSIATAPGIDVEGKDSTGTVTKQVDGEQGLMNQMETIDIYAVSVSALKKNSDSGDKADSTQNRSSDDSDVSKDTSKVSSDYMKADDKKSLIEKKLKQLQTKENHKLNSTLYQKEGGKNHQEQTQAMEGSRVCKSYEYSPRNQNLEKKTKTTLSLHTHNLEFGDGLDKSNDVSPYLTPRSKTEHDKPKDRDLYRPKIQQDTHNGATSNGNYNVPENMQYLAVKYDNTAAEKMEKERNGVIIQKPVLVRPKSAGLSAYNKEQSEDLWSLNTGEEEDDHIQFIEGEQDFFKVFGYDEETAAILMATKVYTDSDDVNRGYDNGDVNSSSRHNGNVSNGVLRHTVANSNKINGGYHDKSNDNAQSTRTDQKKQVHRRTNNPSQAGKTMGKHLVEPRRDASDGNHGYLNIYRKQDNTRIVSTNTKVTADNPPVHSQMATGGDSLLYSRKKIETTQRVVNGDKITSFDAKNSVNYNHNGPVAQPRGNQTSLYKPPASYTSGTKAIPMQYLTAAPRPPPSPPAAAGTMTLLSERLEGNNYPKIRRRIHSEADISSSNYDIVPSHTSTDSMSDTNFSKHNGNEASSRDKKQNFKNFTHPRTNLANEKRKNAIRMNSNNVVNQYSKVSKNQTSPVLEPKRPHYKDVNDARYFQNKDKPKVPQRKGDENAMDTISAFNPYTQAADRIMSRISDTENAINGRNSNNSNSDNSTYNSTTTLSVPNNNRNNNNNNNNITTAFYNQTFPSNTQGLSKVNNPGGSPSRRMSHPVDNRTTHAQATTTMLASKPRKLKPIIHQPSTRHTQQQFASGSN